MNKTKELIKKLNEVFSKPRLRLVTIQGGGVFEKPVDKLIATESSIDYCKETKPTYDDFIYYYLPDLEFDSMQEGKKIMLDEEFDLIRFSDIDWDNLDNWR